MDESVRDEFEEEDWLDGLPDISAGRSSLPPARRISTLTTARRASKETIGHPSAPPGGQPSSE